MENSKAKKKWEKREVNVIVITVLQKQCLRQRGQEGESLAFHSSSSWPPTHGEIAMWKIKSRRIKVKREGETVRTKESH